MKRVLLTGAGGFIGRHTLPTLAARGFEVHAVSAKAPPEDAPAGVRWHRADLTDPAQTSALVALVEPTHLLHFAWHVPPGKFWTATENLLWVRASLHLFAEFAARGGRRVVGAGTCAEYDWQSGDRLYTESGTPLAPATLYGACKHALRLMLEAFARQEGVSAAWGRIFFPYGPGQQAEKLIPSVILSLLREEPALCSHGGQVRDIMFVQDAADAFVALLDSSAEGAVNIASGHSLALGEVVRAVGEKIGRGDLIRLGARPAAAGEPPVLGADVGRLRGEVNWQPRVDLETGLSITIEWFRKHPAAGRAGGE